jgi:hypothetical protein
MPNPPSENSGRSRAIAFAALAAVCVLVAGGFIAWAAIGRDDSVGEDVTLPSAGGATGAHGAAALPVKGLVFENVNWDSGYAHMALTNADGRAPRRITKLVCERAYFGGGRGLCLLSRQGLTSAQFDVKIVDDQLRVVGRRTYSGLLSRARVSPDGRYGATTAFVAGHSYADPGKFSTTTHIIDMASGRDLGNLETFEVRDGGAVVNDKDRNFWGVTFARDSHRFYATMSTHKGTWLIEGSVSGRSAHTLHRNVECPSLSPDGTRVAYKKKVGDKGVIWQLHVLDLRTMKDTATSERANVDDQAEWLDDGTILYAKGTDLWAVRADGSGAPRKYLRDALSPVVLRG